MFKKAKIIINILKQIVSKDDHDIFDMLELSDDDLCETKLTYHLDKNNLIITTQIVILNIDSIKQS